MKSTFSQTTLKVSLDKVANKSQDHEGLENNEWKRQKGF